VDGTASKLLAALTGVVDERVAKSKSWPDSPRALSGGLRRAATFLRKIGIEISYTKEGRALGHFATEREAALAYDRAMILLYGHQAETNFPPEESEHVTLPVEVTRQITALKVGRGRLQ
jgi:hypothetical protein